MIKTGKDVQGDQNNSGHTKKEVSKDDYRMRTQLIHGSFESKHWDYNHHIIPPMSASAAYRLESVNRGSQGFVEYASEEADKADHAPIYIYDRLHEPTRGLLEENLAYAEKGDTSVCFATGMAAISAAIGVTCESGDEIVSHHTIYGCTFSLFTNWLPRYKINARFTDLRKPESLRELINEKTRVIYIESPVNPTLDIIDIAEIRKIVDEIEKPERKIHVIVDNTFATPYCQRPLELGADMVVHSLTKDIGGFGTDMGGVVICHHSLHEKLLGYRKDFGGVLSPKSAWPILVYGLPTLATRMANQENTALHVARFLESHPAVSRVLYPGLDSFPQKELAHKQMRTYDGKFAPGPMIYFVLKGDPEKATARAEKLIDYIAENSYCITLAVSLGQIRTLIEEPYSMTHSVIPGEVKEMRGLDHGGIRLSIGLEDRNDLIEDLKKALDQL